MGKSHRALSHALTLDKELILEAGFAGFGPSVLDVNAWPEDLVKAKAGELRKVLAGDRTRQAIAFRHRFPRLFVTRVAEPSRLTQMRIGENVIVTYTEALAIALEKVEKNRLD